MIGTPFPCRVASTSQIITRAVGNSCLKSCCEWKHASTARRDDDLTDLPVWSTGSGRGLVRLGMMWDFISCYKIQSWRVTQMNVEMREWFDSIPLLHYEGIRFQWEFYSCKYGIIFFQALNTRYFNEISSMSKNSIISPNQSFPIVQCSIFDHAEMKESIHQKCRRVPFIR